MAAAAPDATPPLMRCWFLTAGNNGAPMCTLVPVTDTDVSSDIIGKVQKQIEKRKIKLDGKAKHLRLCIVMESRRNTVYAVPSTIVLAKQMRNAVKGTPKEGASPLVAQCVILDGTRIKKDNPNYVEDSKASIPLKLPDEVQSFFDANLDVRENAPPPVAAASSSASSPASSVPNSPRSPADAETGAKTAPASPPDAAKKLPKKRDASPPSEEGAATATAAEKASSHNSSSDTKSPTTAQAAAAPPSAPAVPPLTPSQQQAAEWQGSVTFHPRGARQRSTASARSGSESPERAEPPLACTITYYRGDLAADVMVEVISRLQATAPADHPHRRALADPRMRLECMMLCVVGEHGFDSYTHSDALPVYECGPATRLQLIDLGDQFTPLAPSASHSDAANTASSAIPHAPTSSGASGLRHHSIRDNTALNYANKDSALTKLENRAEQLQRENAALETETTQLAAHVADKEKARKEAQERLWDARDARRDMQRLSNLKAWFEKELKERESAEQQLRTKLFFGYEDDDVGGSSAGRDVEGSAVSPLPADRQYQPYDPAASIPREHSL